MTGPTQSGKYVTNTAAWDVVFSGADVWVINSIWQENNSPLGLKKPIASSHHWVSVQLWYWWIYLEEWDRIRLSPGSDWPAALWRTPPPDWWAATPRRTGWSQRPHRLPHWSSLHPPGDTNTMQDKFNIENFPLLSILMYRYTVKANRP